MDVPTNPTALTEALGIEVPIIGGAMYPCSNPELVAAVSDAGAIGVIQPMSLSYVHGHELTAGIDYMRTITDKPLGLNLIIEQSSKIYLERTRRWAEEAAEKGVRFFVTALGDPAWVVRLAEQHNITVYHDVTGLRHAQKALDAGVDGFICVNNRAGGHAGTLSPQELFDQIAPLGKPLVCAGGIGDSKAVAEALATGYAGVQLGTRFIASTECNAHADYKRAIVEADASDIVLTEKLTGVPVSVIKTPYIESIGTKAGPFARWMLSGRKTKHWMRSWYTLMSVWKLKKASVAGSAYRDYWQAGKSADTINDIASVSSIIAELVRDIKR
ncbi:MAG: nitronate monooxygenase [Gammaproteobacteria bacterium]|nr:nitronate monooxygenase [Gammaproteobacteria bacterium]